MLVSCRQETVQPAAKISQPLEKHFDTSWMQRISVEDGVLVFANQNDYRVAIDYLQQAPLAEREMLEAKWGFKSQRTLYDQIHQAEKAVVDAEEAKIFAQYPDKTIEELYAMNFPAHTHTPEYEAGMKTGLFKVEEGNNGNNFYIQVVDQTAASVINYDGIVKVGGELRQHIRNYFKIWKNGEIAQKRVLMEAKQSDERNKITVINYSLLMGNSRNRNFNWSKYLDDSGNWTGDIGWGSTWSQNTRQWKARIGVLGLAGSTSSATFTPPNCTNVINLEDYYYLNDFRVRFNARRKVILGNTWNDEWADFGWQSSTWTFGDFLIGQPQASTSPKKPCGLSWINTDIWYEGLLNSNEPNYTHFPGQYNRAASMNFYHSGADFMLTLDPSGFDNTSLPLANSYYFIQFPSISYNFTAQVNVNGSVQTTGSFIF